MPYSRETISRTIAAGLVAAAAIVATPAAANTAVPIHTMTPAPVAFTPILVPTTAPSFVTRPVAEASCAVPAAAARELSALERMKLAQATADQATPRGALSPAAEMGLRCAVTPSRFTATVRPAIADQDFLQSRMLPVSKTAFDGAWTRVRYARSNRATSAAAELGGGSASLEARIEQVNRWVNARVDYVEDAQQYARNDYWASAEETLGRGRGDCEDFAIAKMQILAEMGVSRDAMFLTIARDLVARGDHAVLIVKINGRAMVLDNATDTIADGYTATDLRPVLSFSDSKSFVHGYS